MSKELYKLAEALAGYNTLEPIIKDNKALEDYITNCIDTADEYYAFNHPSVKGKAYTKAEALDYLEGLVLKLNNELSMRGMQDSHYYLPLDVSDRDTNIQFEKRFYAEIQEQLRVEYGLSVKDSKELVRAIRKMIDGQGRVYDPSI